MSHPHAAKGAKQAVVLCIGRCRMLSTNKQEATGDSAQKEQTRSNTEEQNRDGPAAVGQKDAAQRPDAVGWRIEVLGGGEVKSGELAQMAS